MTSTLNNSMSSGPMPDVMGGPMATPGGPSTSLGNQNPPPVPTRPTQQRSGLTSSYGMGGYGSGYGSYGGYSSYSPLGGGMYGGSMYGGGMYGGYGGYSGYGSGLGMNRYGPSEYTSNGFVRQAEESSRQAFQSIESVVQAFGSVTMMLESTFYAVYNSFRAVIGVADHFTRLRTHFAQIFSAFAIIKTLKWLYHRLLVLLRLRQAGMDEDLWANAVSETVKGTGLDGIPGKPKSNWPVWLFFAVVIGAPYLIWRLLSSLSGAKENNSWADGSGDHFVGVAEYSFEGENEDEISFRKGQRLNIAPKELQPRMRGWLLASADGKKQGIVPANYIKVLGKRRGRKQGPQTVQELGNSQLVPSAGQSRNQVTGAGIPHQIEAVYDSTQGDASMNEVFNDNSQNFSSYYPRETSRDTIETKEASDILNDTSKPWEP